MDDKKNAKTSWEGLWFQRPGVYSGKKIKKSDIPAYSRLIVRFNKYWEKDSLRPKYVYCFAQEDASNAITMELSRDEYVAFEDLKNRIFELEEQIESMYTYEQVNRAVRRAAEDGQNGYTDVIASDYL